MSAAKPATKAPARRGGARNVISTALIVIGVILLLVAAGLFIRAQLGYKQAQDSYKGLEQYAVVDQSAASTAVTPDPVPKVDFDALEKINADVVGWIYVPGTPINYPVAQTTDNETYLHRLFDQSDNNSGGIFMDMDDAKPGMVDQQTTLYGHHMNDGTMFKYIDNTLDQAEFDKVGYVYYITRDAVYVCRPLFTMQVPDTYGEARTPTFGDDAALTDYLNKGLAQAHAKAKDADARVAQTKQVLTLVTCAGEIIPRTTRAGMVCELVDTVPTAEATVQASAVS